MFIPIGDVNLQKGTKPLIAYALIVINIVVFVMEFLMPAPQQNLFVTTYGCIPAEITQAQDVFTLFTNMFLHGGWQHLIGNMVFLWVFGDNIEATIGYIKFILFYITGGVVASLTHVFFNIHSPVPSIGASGAIAACLGAYLVMFPASKIKVFVMFLLSSFNVPAILFLGFWIIQQFKFSSLGNITAKSTEEGGIAYWAHIGGFAFGVLCGFLFRKQAVQLQKIQQNKA